MVEELTELINKMALNNNQTVNTIQAAKAIAEFLPIFTGESNQLESFIKRCDKFHTTYGMTPDNSLNDFTFNVIFSKLRGDVLNFVMCRPDLTTWPLIKIALRENYGDRIDRQTLTRDFLHLTKNRNENILDFLEKIKQMKSRLEVKISSDISIPEPRRQLLMEQTEGNALDVLMANVDDKLRLLLDIRQPNNLAQASDIVIRHFYNDQRINSLQFDNRQKQKTFIPPQKPFTQEHPQRSFFNQLHSNNHPIQKQQFMNNFSQPHFSNNRPNFSNQPMYRQPFVNKFSQNNFNKPNFPSQPINIQSRQIPRHFPTNSQVFGKPHNVFAPKNSYKPQSKPEPMSTTSRNPSFHAQPKPQQNNFFQSKGKPDFIVEELFNTETSENNLDISENNYYADNYEDTNYCNNYPPTNTYSSDFQPDFTEPEFQNFQDTGPSDQEP